MEISTTIALDEDFFEEHEDEILEMFVERVENTEVIVSHLNMYNKKEDNYILWARNTDKESLLRDDKRGDYSSLDEDYAELMAMRKILDEKIAWMDENLDMRKIAIHQDGHIIQGEKVKMTKQEELAKRADPTLSIESLEERVMTYYINKGDREKLEKLEKWFEIKVIYQRNWRVLTIIDLTDSMKNDEVIGNEFGSIELWHIVGQVIGRLNAGIGLPHGTFGDKFISEKATK